MTEPISLTAMVEEEEETGPRLIRITNHGKMHTWVAFALESLEKHEDRPIALHTLPAVPKPPTDAQGPDPKHPPGSLSNSTTTVPRLISVVEIIKREYIKTLELKRSPRLLGLHQYNEIGCLEDLGLVEVPETDESKRAEELVAALSGKKYVKQKQTPYMKVTLSVNELGEDYKNATYQPPAIRKLSKSAKARAKKRERNTKKVEGATEEKKEDSGGGEVMDSS